MGKKGKAKRKEFRQQTGIATDQKPAAANQAQAEQLFAVACHQHQQGQLEAAEKSYRQTVQLDAGRVNAWRNLGALLRGRGENAQGRLCTEQALKLDPSDGSLWGNYGNVLRNLELLEESARAFREGLQRKPGDLGLLQGLAITLARHGEHQQVVELLAPVVEQSEAGAS